MSNGLQTCRAALGFVGERSRPHYRQRDTFADAQWRLAALHEERPTTVVTAIVPCNGLDVAEAPWNCLGFARPADLGHDDKLMLSDGFSGEIHLNQAVENWVIPKRDPFGIYLYAPRVDALAETLGELIFEPTLRPEHRAWGMYEFVLNGPDDLLVGVRWPSRLIRRYWLAGAVSGQR